MRFRGRRKRRTRTDARSAKQDTTECFQRKEEPMPWDGKARKGSLDERETMPGSRDEGGRDEPGGQKGGSRFEPKGWEWGWKSPSLLWIQGEVGSIRPTDPSSNRGDPNQHKETGTGSWVG
eukprot:scaffold1982_cov358-Pavlova_lutheri.AAC.9